jgi:hypothetical protein
MPWTTIVFSDRRPAGGSNGELVRLTITRRQKTTIDGDLALVEQEVALAEQKVALVEQEDLAGAIASRIDLILDNLLEACHASMMIEK